MGSYSVDAFVLVGLLIWALLIALYLKRRAAKKAARDEWGAIEGTHSDREAAEDRLRSLPLDLRAHVAETHTLYDRYSTRHGYSPESIEILVDKLRQQGFDCEVVFQPIGIIGMDSLIAQPGMFELYVLNDQIDRARQVIPGLLAR